MARRSAVTRFLLAGPRRLLWPALALSLPACSSPQSWDEVRRVLAPAGKVDAVLAERHGGPTRGLEYDVYVVPNGAVAQNTKPAAILHGAARNDSAYGAELHWVGPNTLSVEYLRAEREALLTPEVEVAGVPIWVVLSPGKRDSPAPAGRMLRPAPGPPK
jgi:hypothetical protein